MSSCAGKRSYALSCWCIRRRICHHKLKWHLLCCADAARFDTNTGRRSCTICGTKRVMHPDAPLCRCKRQVPVGGLVGIDHLHA